MFPKGHNTDCNIQSVSIFYYTVAAFLHHSIPFLWLGCIFNANLFVLINLMFFINSVLCVYCVLINNTIEHRHIRATS